MKKILLNNRWPLVLPDHRAGKKGLSTNWEKLRLDEMYKTVGKGDVVYDIGAEEGDMPALYATWGATVICFEPNPLVWPNIRVTWEANNLPTPPAYWVGFASDKTLERPERMQSLFAGPPKDGWPACAYGKVISDHGFRSLKERTHDTPQIRIDDFVKHNPPPTVISVDSEGSEWQVLKGAERTLRERKPVLFLSIHPELMFGDYGQYQADFHGWLHSLGYEGKYLDFSHEYHFRFEVPK